MLFSIVGRKSPAPIRLSSKSNIFWTTVGTKDRISWLCNEFAFQELQKIWREIACAWPVGDFILMPDHIHFFCAPHDRSVPFDHWISFWKSCFSKSHPNVDWRWLRKAWPTRIISSQHYQERWWYMMNNPLRKGLVTRVEDWPWKGTIHRFGAFHG